MTKSTKDYKPNKETGRRSLTWNCVYCKKDCGNMDILSLITHTGGKCLPKEDKRK